VYVVAFAPTVQVAPAGDEVTTYEVIAEPPLSAGASKVTVMLLPIVTAATFAGADGTPAGVTSALAEDSADVPTVVTATTLKV
jgi:hypothetical protein